MDRRQGRPKYAPGIDDADIIPKANKDDKRNGSVTTETRVFLDENHPSGRDWRDPD